ncbi:MAG: cytochrome c [Phycisphaerales bacterium]|nr:cytochrome c [Phycisphaerales bacterium]
MSTLNLPASGAPDGHLVHAAPAQTASGSPRPAAWVAEAIRAVGLRPGDIGVFLLLDLLLVAGAAVLVLTQQVQHPDAFVWGRRLVNQQRGLLMAAALALSGVAALWGLLALWRDRPRGAAAALVVALLGGLGFAVVLGIDLDSKSARRLMPGERFRPNERYVAAHFGVKLPRRVPGAPTGTQAIAAAAPSASAKREVSATKGRTLYMNTCATCHGVTGEGVVGSGRDLRGNVFVAGLDDAKLVDFLKVGRQPWDPANTTNVQMPPRGGNPTLSDDDLRDIAAYLRTMQPQGVQPSASAEAATGTTPTEGTAGSGQAAPPASPPELLVHRSYIDAGAVGPAGLSPTLAERARRPRWAMPADAASYFEMFLTSVGLQVVHVALAVVLTVVGLVALARNGRPLVWRGVAVLACGAWIWAAGTWFVLGNGVYGWV